MWILVARRGRRRIPQLLHLLLLLLFTTSTFQFCNARRDGAYGCAGGQPAVGGAHVDGGEFGTPITGSLDDGGNRVVLGGVVLDAEQVPNTIGRLLDDDASSYEFAVTSYDRVPFKGALVRFEVLSSSSNSNGQYEFAIASQENNTLVKAADDVCFGPEVQGITHTDNSFKTALAGNLILATPSAVEFTVDVTVVDFNNRDSGSQFWYTQYIVAFDGAPTERPTAAPPTAPVPSSAAPTPTTSTGTPSLAAPTPTTTTPTTAPEKESKNVCFSGDTVVRLEDGSLRPMHQLRVGDRVPVFEYYSSPLFSFINNNHHDYYHYEPVYAFAKQDASVVADYVRIEWNDNDTNSNNNSSSSFLEMSPKHLVLARPTIRPATTNETNNSNPQQSAASSVWTMIPASHLQAGTHQIRVLRLDQGETTTTTTVAEVTVQSIRRVSAPGAFAPLTFSGTLLVHGSGSGSAVYASTYVSMQNTPHLMMVNDMQIMHVVSWHWLAHTFVTPLRYLGACTTWLLAAAPPRLQRLNDYYCSCWCWLPTFFGWVDWTVLAVLTHLPTGVSLPLLVIPALAVLGVVSLVESSIARIMVMMIRATAVSDNDNYVRLVFIVGLLMAIFWWCTLVKFRLTIRRRETKTCTLDYYNKKVV